MWDHYRPPHCGRHHRIGHLPHCPRTVAIRLHLTLLPVIVLFLSIDSMVYFSRWYKMREIKEPIHLAKLLDPYKGKWVTLTQDEKSVLGAGDTIDEALKKAEEHGELLPFLIKVPDQSTTAILYWSLSHTLSVPYTELTSLPPNQGVMYSPRLPTILENDNVRTKFSFPSVVDSGADNCVFPATFGEMIGLNRETGIDPVETFYKMIFHRASSPVLAPATSSLTNLGP